MEEEYNVVEENKQVLEDICKKFVYSEELKLLLEKIIPAMTNGKSYEIRQDFYKMLKTTPIVILPKDSPVSEEEIKSKMLSGINANMIEKNINSNNFYHRFITKPIIDEFLNLIGVKKFILIEKLDSTNSLSSKEKLYMDVFNTTINVSELISSLGYAWASQVTPYKIEEDILTQRIGVCSIKYKLSKIESNVEVEEISRVNEYLEEGLNKNLEISTIATCIDKSVDEVKEMYNVDGILYSTDYKYLISCYTEKLSSKDELKKNVEGFRFSNNTECLENLNQIFARSNFYKNRDKIYQRFVNLNGVKIELGLIQKRNELFNRNKDNEIISSFEKDYFPNCMDMSPMELLNNILLEYQDITSRKLEVNKDLYMNVIDIVSQEGYGLINQVLNNM